MSYLERQPSVWRMRDEDSGMRFESYNVITFKRFNI